MDTAATAIILQMLFIELSPQRSLCAN